MMLDFVRTCEYSVNGICIKIDFLKPQSLSIPICDGNWFKICCKPIEKIKPANNKEITT
jgi:hypothetical protein